MGWNGMRWDGMGWKLPLLPQLPPVLLERPHPDPWSWIWMVTTLTTPTTVCFLERPHPQIGKTTETSSDIRGKKRHSWVNIETRFRYFMEAFSEIKGKEFLEIQNLIPSQLFKKNSNRILFLKYRNCIPILDFHS